MATADQELIIILSQFSIPVSTRIQGWEYLLSLTGSKDGIKKIISYQKYGVFLEKYIMASKPEKETKEMAYKCILNLSSSSEGTGFLLSCKNLLPTLLGAICSASSLTTMQCSILSNFSNFSNLLDMEGFVPLFTEVWENKLSPLFCSSDETTRENYAYLALLFSNLSGTSEGKKLLVNNSIFFNSFLTSLELQEADPRRLGIALTLRNCCTETSLHHKLLEDYNILPLLLQPLMEGCQFKEEEKKELPQVDKVWRERVPQVRKAIIQALSMMCYSEEGWNYLKNHGVYYVCREFHLLEPDVDVKEAVETLVGYMLVERYGDVTLEPGHTDQLQDIPDFLLSTSEKLPVLDAYSNQEVNAMKSASNSQWYSS